MQINGCQISFLPSVPGCSYTHKLTKDESNALSQLLEKLANQSMFWLSCHQSLLNQYEVQLKHLHPLTFLEHSFLNEENKSHFKKIANRGWPIWSTMVQNLEANFEKQKQQGNLMPHLSDFSRAIGLRFSKVVDWVQNHEIEFLIQEALRV